MVSASTDLRKYRIHNESMFSLSVCGLFEIVIEFDAEWESTAGIVVAIGYGSRTSVIAFSSSIRSASEIPPESLLPWRLESVALHVLSNETK